MNHHNHQPIVFHQDTDGYVAFCPGCHCFQLGFGNIYITQTREDLTYLADVINRMLHLNYKRKNRYLRNIHLDSPYEGFGLLLSVVDLEKLDHILQKTMLILEVDDPVRNQ